MKSRKTKWLSTVLSGTGAGLYPVLSSALGLGDLQVDSHLNQPLRARIEIVGVSDEEWRRIRARVASESTSSGDVVHPELLDSITLSAIEDANHRHFIQVSSGSVLTEPLFDLPIEVSSESTHLIRSYAVLLDPEATGSVPQNVAESNVTHDSPAVADVTVAQPAKADSAAVAPRVAAVGHHARRHTSLRHAKHVRSRRHSPGAAPGSAHSALAKNSHASAPQAQLPGSGADEPNTQSKGSAQEQLERQLAMLQQTLAQMQATIAAQDAEIAKLTRAVAAANAPAEASVVRSSTVPLSSKSLAPPDSDVDTSDDAEPNSSRRRPSFFYWVASAVGLTAILAAATLWFARRRKAEAARGFPVEDRYSQARKEVSKRSYPVERSSSYQVEEHSESSGIASPGAASSAGASPGNVPAEQDGPDGIESWRTQTALLEQDFLSATDVLPFAADEKKEVKPLQAKPISPAAADEEKTLELQRFG